MAEPFLGEIRLFAFGLVPKGWMPCQGQIIQVQQNQALFVILGAAYGGNGSTTFALPDFRGRVPLHTAPPYGLGAAGGEATHVLTVNEMPMHTHTVSGAGELATLIPPTGNVWPQRNNTYSAAVPDTMMGSSAMSVAGGSQAHNNMQPYTALNFCIASVGIFPSRQ